MIEEWNERLQCPQCGATGMASLRQGEGEEAPRVLVISRGFTVVTTPAGHPDFQCGDCKIAAKS